MKTAPLFADVAQGPGGGEAFWLTATDATRIRAAAWPAANGVPQKGTVLLFPGRTEYIEKYGRIAADFTARGFNLVAIDWRGQGLADRKPEAQALGHVTDFEEFQADVAAVVNLSQWLELPEPWFLVGHSMGGCIGLRALHNGLDVRAAAFSAPMWGIQMETWEKPLAWMSAILGAVPAFKHRLTPRTDATHALLSVPFDDNELTTDPSMWDFMRQQLVAYPELALGGPTLAWLRAALFETTRLARLPAPQTPSLTFLGTNERIVDAQVIERMMSGWDEGHLEIVRDAEHEIMMERPEIRDRFVEMAVALFERHRQS